MEIKEILSKYASGELVRDNDETGKDGLWDYARDIVNSTSADLTASETEQMQENIYNALQEVREICL